MKRFLKNRVLWLILYGIVITGVFLYFLFPSELLKPKLEAAVSSQYFSVKTRSFQPSLPLGLKLTGLSVHAPGEPAEAAFRSDWLDVQLIPWSVFQKYRFVRFKGEAYSGKFNGRAGLTPRGGAYALAEGRILFQGIDLAGYGPRAFLLKGMTGKVKGSLEYSAGAANGTDPSGKISLYLSQGAYPLPEPFLGVTRLEFDRGELHGQLKNGNIAVDKLEIYGSQMNCFLSGDIRLADPAPMSQLNLKGTLEIAGKNKVKMNITVGGTLASPSFRYM